MNNDQTDESPGTKLCKACGLCCTGHLFSWVRLRASELDASEALGLKVIRSDPRQRGFIQPCPLWNGQCTIYNSLDYPHVCGTYKCKLLKELLDENIPLPQALAAVQRAKDGIAELETLLPASSNPNFRERLVAHVKFLEESMQVGEREREFQLKAKDLLALYKDYFGVNDLLD